ncbi:MAG: DUF6629 family protein [Candidatus Paceibacterota bacterium]
MCFSATASFATSAVLGATGVATLSKTKNRKAYLLSSIPLLFAIQQFIEGLIWVSINSWPSLTLPLTRIFLFFALFLWPIYIPMMILLIEPIKIRRIIISFFCAGGAIIGTMFFMNFLQQPEAASVLNHCIYYPDQVLRSTLLNCIYVFIVVCSGLISSRPIIKILSLLVFASSIITYVFYVTNFTSVWCFFAAIISLILFFNPQK